MKNKDYKRVANFLYEIGSMRKLPRIHSQLLLTDDSTDNIAAHSYRVTMIGWILAEMEKVNVSKVIKMCLLHDVVEARSGDHNWPHKKYVKIFDNEIKEEQLGTLPFGDRKEILEEYDKRKSKESIIAKDADLLDQIILLREYEWQGNKEAALWLRGEPSAAATENKIITLKTKSAKALGRAIYKENPSNWWKDLSTNKNR